MKIPKARKLPSGSWFIQLRIDGQSVPVTAQSERECKRKAELIKAEQRNGKSVDRADNITLSKAIDKYIDARKNTLSPSTIRGYRTFQKSRFQSVMNKPISKISDWQAVCDAEAALCSAKTLKNAYSFVQSVLRSRGVSVRKAGLPQIVEPDLPWLTPEQVSAFVDAANGEISALLALHGLRRSEILALTWDHVNLPERTIKVSGAAVFNADQKLVQKKENKNTSSARVVPIMIPQLLDALERAEDKTGLVVRCHPNTVYERINAICRRAGLPEVGVHGLRRSFASLGYHLKMSEREIMDLGGWSDYQTMHKIYIKLSAADKQNAASKMLSFYKNANEIANENQKVI